MRRSTMKQTTAAGLFGDSVPSRAASLSPRRSGFSVSGPPPYWPQFDGLLDEMKRKLALFVNKSAPTGGQVIDFGIADDARSAYSRQCH